MHKMSWLDMVPCWISPSSRSAFFHENVLFTFYISHTVTYNIITHNKQNHRHPQVSLHRRPVWPSRDGAVPRHMPSRPRGELSDTFPCRLPPRRSRRICTCSHLLFLERNSVPSEYVFFTISKNTTFSHLPDLFTLINWTRPVTGSLQHKPMGNFWNWQASLWFQ